MAKTKEMVVLVRSGQTDGGTPLFRILDGVKRCKFSGGKKEEFKLFSAFSCPAGVFCPGCPRRCRLPDDVEAKSTFAVDVLR
ncbi:MAG: hypothetical protein ACNI3A_18625 [Desulfovibrio sp.]|uniref:hypothetical protein n=1 Tax=Desulfovibrio sp. 7SRBS1 TaxID=3378064 RepID=UPI003B40F7DC